MTGIRRREVPEPVPFRITKAQRLQRKEGDPNMLRVNNEVFEIWSMNLYEAEDMRDGDKCLIAINRRYFTGNQEEDEVIIHIRNIGKRMEAEPYPKRARVEGINDNMLKLRKHTDKEMIELLNGRVENEEELLS